MGAGSVHQATQKGNSMGLIMPLYTIGIVAFFVYTVMKVNMQTQTSKSTNENDTLLCLQLVMKKQENPLPYPETLKANPNFKQEVFCRDATQKNIPNFGK